MNKKQTITIERKSAFFSAATRMNVVIDNVLNRKFANGESVVVEIPQNKDEFIVHAQDHLFEIIDLKQVKKIVLQFGVGYIKCVVIYQDGREFPVINKNSGALTSKYIYIIGLLLLALSIILRHM